MREHFPDDYQGIIASDQIWEELMKNLPPHFIIQREKKVVFLVKGIFPDKVFLDKNMVNFPKGNTGMLIRCEESFYKMRMKENNI